MKTAPKSLVAADTARIVFAPGTTVNGVLVAPRPCPQKRPRDRASREPSVVGWDWSR